MEDYIVSILVTLFIAGIVYGAVKYFSSSTPSGTTSIVATSQDAKKDMTYSGDIPLSKNQPDGLSFAYAGWVFVDDYTYRYGEKKIAFVKGTPDLSVACPALVLDAHTNTFLVYVDTFGSQEIVPISNLTAQKWIHFAIVVDQTAVSVYINGTLHTYHTMNQLPKQNSAKLLITPGGGFSGKVGYLQYYPTLLTPSDVSGLAQIAPIETSSIGILPPYQDTKWWLPNRSRK
jgi:hypothetical protein